MRLDRKRIMTLYVKEMLEILRNWGTIIVIFFMPLLAYPTTTIFITQISASQMEKLSRKTLTIAVTGESRAPELVRRLQEKEGLNVTLPGIETPESIPTKNRALVKISDDFASALSGDRSAGVSVYYDKTDEESELARNRTEDVLKEYKNDLVEKRLKGANLQPFFIEPLEISYENVAPPSKVTGEAVGRTFPLLLIVFVLVGAIQVAVDLTAGEKERRTIQTLLLTPLSRIEILLAKLLVILTTTFTTALINLASIGLTTMIILRMIGDKAPKISLSPPAALASFLIMVPLVTLLSALFLMVGLLARNQLEASIYIMPLLFLGVIPAALPALPGFKSNLALAFLPVANTALAIKEIFLGDFSMLPLSVAFLSNLVYAGLTLILSARLFQKEEVIFGGVSEVIFYRRDLLRPSPGEVILFYLGALGLFFFAGTPIQAWNLYEGIAITQFLLLLAPVLMFLRMRGYPVITNLRLRRLSVRNFFLCLALGGVAAVGSLALGNLQERFIQTPKDIHKFMVNMVTIHGWKEALLVLAVVALLPAIVEEITFRGLILRGLELSTNRVAVCLLTGFLFSFFHMNIYILFPITLVGALLAYVVLVTDSIFAGVIIHFCLNGANILLANLAPENFSLPWYITAFSFILLYPAMRLLKAPDTQSAKEISSRLPKSPPEARETNHL